METPTHTQCLEPGSFKNPTEMFPSMLHCPAPEGKNNGQEQLAKARELGGASQGELTKMITTLNGW